MKTLITFRLRKDLDADLMGMEIDEKQLAELCRNGLRLILGIRTTKRIEVTEVALPLPTRPLERRLETNYEIPSRGTKQQTEPQRTPLRAAGGLLLNTNRAPANNAGTRSGGGKADK